MLQYRYININAIVCHNRFTNAVSSLTLCYYYRNPAHDRRPKFSDICHYLQQPVSKLLHWSQSDNGISLTMNTLGVTLKQEEADKVYADLQYKYQ